MLPVIPFDSPFQVFWRLRLDDVSIIFKESLIESLHFALHEQFLKLPQSVIKKVRQDLHYSEWETGEGG